MFLGRISYPFYLTHQPIIRLVKNTPHMHNFIADNSLLAATIAVLISLLFSYIVVLYVDEPVRRYLSQALLTPRTSRREDARGIEASTLERPMPYNEGERSVPNEA